MPNSIIISQLAIHIVVDQIALIRHLESNDAFSFPTAIFRWPVALQNTNCESPMPFAGGGSACSLSFAAALGARVSEHFEWDIIAFKKWVCSIKFRHGEGSPRSSRGGLKDGYLLLDEAPEN